MAQEGSMKRHSPDERRDDDGLVAWFTIQTNSSPTHNRRKRDADVKFEWNVTGDEFFLPFVEEYRAECHSIGSGRDRFVN